MNDLESVSIYNGDHVHDNSSLIMRYSYNGLTESLEYSGKDAAKDNIYLRNETVVSLLEFERNKIIVACEPRNLVLFHGG